MGEYAVTVIHAANAMQPRQDQQSGAHMPWGPARQELPLFISRQVGHCFQIHVDGFGERGLDLLKGQALNGEVKIDAKRLPLQPASMSMAPKHCIHVELLRPSPFGYPG